jgi:dimethylglycine dehydrogenase
MKTKARAVVIGGGVVGCSVAYHLAKIGWSDVVLLEKNELTSGSTWHAAGGVTTLNADANVSRLQKYTFDLYRELEQVTGQSCGIHHNGGIYLASSDGQMDFLKLIHSRARYLKMDTELISVAEAKRRNVLIAEEYFKGALWREDGGYVDPWLVTQAYATASRDLGVEIERFTRVTALEAAGRRQLGRRHRQGRHPRRARRQRGRAVGARGRQDGRPVDPGARDGASLHRHRGGAGARGAGARDHQHVGLHRRDLPAPGRPGRAARHLRAGKRALGARRDAGRLPQPAPARRSRAHLAGARARFQAFPGGRQGRAQEGGQRPLHLRPGRQSAGRTGPGPAELLARLRGHGRVQPGRRHRPGAIALDGSERSRQDVLAMDAARFGVFATPRYTRIKVEENYRRRFRLAYPNEEMPAARPFRRTPVYDTLKAKGAVFGANFALENALWFAPPGVAPVEEPTYRRSDAFAHVKCASAARCASRSGSTRPRTTARYEITGPRRTRLSSTACSPAGSRARGGWRSHPC